MKKRHIFLKSLKNMCAIEKHHEKGYAFIK